MSESSRLLKFNFVNYKHYSAFLFLANTIYLDTFSNKEYLKLTLFRDTGIVKKYVCNNFQSIICAAPIFALYLTDQQQILRAYSR
jgi:hypothetical protein